MCAGQAEENNFCEIYWYDWMKFWRNLLIRQFLVLVGDDKAVYIYLADEESSKV